MRIILSLSTLGLLLVACTPAEPEKPVLMNGAKIGEFCGGIAGIACDEGLICTLDGTYPDAGGICEDPESAEVEDASTPLATEGEFCGGIANIPCKEGLLCEFEGKFPDAGGVCVTE